MATVAPMLSKLQTTQPTMCKVCRVCGDKAIGYNFNSLTCESCKSFFRRNALKYDKFICRKEGNCLIDFVTRKCCTKCRLDKCFSSGMRKELICRKIDNMETSSSSPSTELDAESAHSQSSLATANIDRLLEADIRQKISACSLLYPTPPEYVLTKASVPVRRKYVVELHTHELDRLKEVNVATESAAFFNPSRIQLVGEATNLVFALNCAELYIRKAIRFCKSFTSFKCLTQDDQLILIKGFFAELMIIRLSFVFDRLRNGWPVIIDDVSNQAIFVKLSLLYESKTKDFVCYSRDYMVKFQDEMEQDSQLSDLILAMRLFTPRDALSCSEFIRYQHSVYQLLLRRYLEHTFRDVDHAEAKLKRIDDLLKELHQPAKDILESMFIEVDSSQLSLVLTELYKNR